MFDADVTALTLARRVPGFPCPYCSDRRALPELRGLGSKNQAGYVGSHKWCCSTPRSSSPTSGVKCQARRAEITIRKTLDCLIAAPCVRDGIPILHSDADFDRLATCTPLEIFRAT